MVGGLAVLCRLGTAYRSTSDLDTVHRRAAGERPQLQVLLATGVQQSGPAGATIPTPAGMVQVDKNRTIRLIRGIPEGKEVDDDTIDLIAQLLLVELARS